ncbi:hypothetical protein FDK12_10885 [Arthrobacter sp. NamB2]|uniref:hypothetical protein n=1 Tax=Arthrobacter sp. NamB2 TaxID=2576035 RepID=UPI0010CA1260|nr:hypothetical protein [Arthrobacter sp. NamB2]TKV27976.1 hypothetical protein FDK12_10885 [Arthrobacter sp. NamB2]
MTIYAATIRGIAACWSRRIAGTRRTGPRSVGARSPPSQALGQGMILQGVSGRADNGTEGIVERHVVGSTTVPLGAGTAR